MIPKKGKVLVDFWRQWCGPCLTMMPILEKYSETEGCVELIKINVDENPDISQEYNVRGIPTFIYFEDGEVVKRQTGTQTLEQLKELTKS